MKTQPLCKPSALRVIITYPRALSLPLLLSDPVLDPSSIDDKLAGFRTNREKDNEKEEGSSGQVALFGDRASRINEARRDARTFLSIRSADSRKNREGGKLELGGRKRAYGDRWVKAFLTRLA